MTLMKSLSLPTLLTLVCLSISGIKAQAQMFGSSHTIDTITYTYDTSIDDGTYQTDFYVSSGPTLAMRGRMGATVGLAEVSGAFDGCYYNGGFHPLTADDTPTGVDEVFTASIAVRGTTPQHGEWRGASALHAGDRVWLSSGESGEVTSVRRLAGAANGTLTTYNFEVSEHHTYFVGRTGVWVHNSCSKAVEKALSVLKDIGYDNVPSGQKSKAVRTWLMNKNKKDRPGGYETGFLLHRSNVDDLADLDGSDIPLASLKQITTSRGLRHADNTGLLGNSSDSKQGSWRSHHIYGDWINTDMNITDVDYNDLPNILLPGGGTANRQLFTGDFAKMTKGIDGSGYDAPFHDGKALEGLEARITAIRDKYRGRPQTQDVRSGMGQELYDTMAQGPHGKMGLHNKFKTIYNSVMRAKGFLDHLIE